MADIRCPMCGKSNPPGQDICQFCQARLTPLRFDEESRSEPVGPDDQKDGSLPDWLQSLRQPGQDPDANRSSEKELSPDWLSGLREETFDGGAEGDTHDESDAWTFDTPPNATHAGNGNSSWLDSMRSDLDSIEPGLEGAGRVPRTGGLVQPAERQ